MWLVLQAQLCSACFEQPGGTFDPEGMLAVGLHVSAACTQLHFDCDNRDAQ
jgi:hypothetical protein